MKKGLLWLSRIGIGLGAVATTIGLIYSSHPEYFDYVFDFLGMTEEEIETVSYLMGFTVVAGVVTKVLKLGVNSDMLGLEVKYERMLSQNSDTNKHMIFAQNQAIEEIKNNDIEHYNELRERQDYIDRQNALILEGQVLTAKRVVRYEFTSDLEKQEAQAFIDKVRELTASEDD